MMYAHAYVTLVETEYVVKYTATATMALVAYDHLIAFSDELRYIWRGPFSLSKVTLLTNRYLPSITTGFILYMDLFANSFCKTLLRVGSILFCTGFVVAEGILLMRLYAVWSRNRTILLLLVFLFIPCLLTAYYGTVRFVSFASPSEVITQSGGCIFTFGNRTAYESLLALLFFETCMLALLISRYYRVREVKSALIEMLWRDGAFFYASVLILTAVNLILLKTASPSLCYFFLIAQGALHSILSNRLVLRLRGAGDGSDVPEEYPSNDDPNNLDESVLSENVSAMYFSSVASDIVLSP